MIVLAILATLGAIGWSVLTVFANGMRSSPGAFRGAGGIALAWAIAAAVWVAWWVG